MAEHACYAFRISVDKDFDDEPEILRTKLEKVKETSLASGFVGIFPDANGQCFSFLFRTQEDRDVAYLEIQKIFRSAEMVSETVVVGSF